MFNNHLFETQKRKFLGLLYYFSTLFRLKWNNDETVQ